MSRVARAAPDGSRRLRARDRARPSGGRGARRDAVRDSDRGRVRRLRGDRREGSGDRGGPRRPARRDERHRRARRAPHERGLEHTEVLGDTREAIAREKLAVARPGAVVVLPDAEFAHLVPDSDVRVGGAREAAAAFLGRDVEFADARLPGRFEIRGHEIGTAHIRLKRSTGCSSGSRNRAITSSSRRSSGTRTQRRSSNGRARRLDARRNESSNDRAVPAAGREWRGPLPARRSRPRAACRAASRARTRRTRWPNSRHRLALPPCRPLRGGRGL